MAKRKQKKPTIKELMNIIRLILSELKILTMQVFNGDKALDLYIEMKGEKDEFIKFLSEHKEKNDKNNKEAEKK